MARKNSLFETMTCTRCGGCGNYSYNQINGTTCFGCGGSGLMLTKRGKAAAAFYRASIQRPIAEIRIGDWVRDSWPNDHRWAKVTEIGGSLSRYLEKTTNTWLPYVEILTRKGGQCVFPNSTVESVKDKAHMDALTAAAKAYEGTLTQAGTQRKRAA